MKVGRPKGINSVHKSFNLDKQHLDFWNSQPNKNRMVNNAIEKLKNETKL